MLYKHFHPWEKPQQYMWKRYDNFWHVWYRQSAADKSLVFRATLSKPSPISIRIMAAKTQKIRIAYWHRRSMALAMAFLAAENENRQLEDLPQAAFLKRFLLSVRKKSINENFVNESYARCLFCNDSTYFLCRALPPTYFMTFLGGFWIHYLSSINKLSMLVKGYIVFIW